MLPALLQGQEKKDPSFEEVLSLQHIGSPKISPDGKHVVFTRSSTDWKENRYDTELWLSGNGEVPFQLTNNPDGSSFSPLWSPDGKWISFISGRSGKNQIYVISPRGGEPFQVTEEERSVGSHRWSPDGTRLSFRMSKEKDDDDRKDKYGSYAVEDKEYTPSQIWIQEFDPAQLGYMPTPEQINDSLYKEQRKARLIMDSVDFTVTSYLWSPDGKYIAFAHQPDPLINTFFKSDISIYDIESETFELLVDNPSADGLICWSPDSKSIIYGSDLEDSTSNYYLNTSYFRIDINGKNKKQLAAGFDEWISNWQWTPKGMFGTAWQKTRRVMLRINPKNGNTEILDSPVERFYSYSFSDDGESIAFTGAGDKDLAELYLGSFPPSSGVKITSASAQITDWNIADSEVISWKSKDGATIEGVLQKPLDYDPAKKYPLLVVIHGGPTGISTPSPAPSYVYPIVQWLNKGSLVLQPNYRGSAGYGEAFRSLNVKNLGVGDAWDVLSGIKYLEEEGLIDPDRVGAMGWSQGGYISAFLTTSSERFRAISVGAGISNWMTYYVNTDIHPFTRQYLKATPWSDKEIYEKTSPMTYINNASTPTLIQHGEYDRRVPPANAFELYQGLQDIGVESKLVIYKGFGHGISKPKERLAAVWHNWHWFGKYIWDEDIEIPMK